MLFGFAIMISLHQGALFTRVPIDAILFFLLLSRLMRLINYIAKKDYTTRDGGSFIHQPPHL